MSVNPCDRRTAKGPNRKDTPLPLLPYRPPEVKKERSKRASASFTAHADRDEQRECDSPLPPKGCEGNSEHNAARSDEALAEEQVWNDLQCRLAHDLNNYVGIVMGRAQLLAEKCATDKRMIEDCSHIISASRRIAALVRRFSLSGTRTF